MLRRFSEHSASEPVLPEIDGERCVHALTENASCAACVHACPKDAWVLDDGALGLDTEACDGCGLCVPACPEAAIAHGYELVVRGAVALGACAPAEADVAEGILPCLHALGLRDLLPLHRQGVREIVVAHGDCDRCPRGRTGRLGDVVGAINQALAARDLPPFRLRRVDAASFGRELHRATAAWDRPALSRRALFRGTARRVIVDAIEPPSHQFDGVAPPGLFFDDQAQPGPLPWVPRIDPDGCEGCDACARLCPHEAISLVDDDDDPHYRIMAARCTGCRLCVDVCERHAVTLDHWQIPGDGRIPLDRDRCGACGAPFHLPAGRLEEARRCRICARHNHHRNLFQVLDTPP